jgi:hypothetical protein
VEGDLVPVIAFSLPASASSTRQRLAHCTLAETLEPPENVKVQVFAF